MSETERHKLVFRIDVCNLALGLCANVCCMEMTVQSTLEAFLN